MADVGFDLQCVTITPQPQISLQRFEVPQQSMGRSQGDVYILYTSVMHYILVRKMTRLPDLPAIGPFSVSRDPAFFYNAGKDSEADVISK